MGAIMMDVQTTIPEGMYEEMQEIIRRTKSYEDIRQFVRMAIRDLIHLERLPDVK